MHMAHIDVDKSNTYVRFAWARNTRNGTYLNDKKLINTRTHTHKRSISIKNSIRITSNAANQ